MEQRESDSPPRVTFSYGKRKQKQKTMASFQVENSNDAYSLDAVVSPPKRIFGMSRLRTKRHVNVNVDQSATTSKPTGTAFKNTQEAMDYINNSANFDLDSTVSESELEHSTHTLPLQCNSAEKAVTPTSAKRASRKNPTPRKLTPNRQHPRLCATNSISSSSSPQHAQPRKTFNVKEAVDYINDSNNFSFNTTLTQSSLSDSICDEDDPILMESVDNIALNQLAPRRLSPSFESSSHQLGDTNNGRNNPVDNLPESQVHNCSVGDIGSPICSVPSTPCHGTPGGNVGTPEQWSQFPSHLSPIGLSPSGTNSAVSHSTHPVSSTPSENGRQNVADRPRLRRRRLLSPAVRTSTAHQGPLTEGSSSTRNSPGTSTGDDPLSLNLRVNGDRAPVVQVPQTTVLPDNVVQNPQNISTSHSVQGIVNPSYQWVLDAVSDNGWTETRDLPPCPKEFPATDHPFMFDLGPEGTEPNPVIFFRAMWSEQLFHQAVTETNVYAERKCGKFLKDMVKNVHANNLCLLRVRNT